jgi:hypothetical protein
MAALQGLEAKNDGPVLEIGVLQGLVAKTLSASRKSAVFLEAAKPQVKLVRGKSI